MWFLTGKVPVHVGRTVIGTDGLSYSVPTDSSRDEFLASLGWQKAPDKPIFSSLYCDIAWDSSLETWVPVPVDFETRSSFIEEHKTVLINHIRGYAREARNALVDDTMPESVQASVRTQNQGYMAEIQEISAITYVDANIDSSLTSFDVYNSVVETDKAANPDAVNLFLTKKINNLTSQPLKHSL